MYEGVPILACLLPALAVLVMSVLAVAVALRIVQEHTRLVVFRLGRFLGVRGPGLLLLLPFVDRAVAVDLRQQVRRLEGQAATTQDDKRVTVDLVWSYRIVDPACSVLAVENLEAALQEMSATLLRTAVAATTREELFRDHEPTRAQIHARLCQVAEPWGIDIEEVEIRDIRRI